nr:RNA-binding S4 domain-containing protein [candidate division Zixibacteria bacterium]
MRLDQYLSKVGLIKRRTVAKEMADSGLIKKNGERCKPAGEVNEGDIISVGGSHPLTIKITALPAGNVKKEERENYYQSMA